MVRPILPQPFDALGRSRPKAPSPLLPERPLPPLPQVNFRLLPEGSAVPDGAVNLVEVRVAKNAHAPGASRQRSSPVVQPRQTVGWSGTPVAAPSADQTHLALIHRGLEHVGAGQMRALRNRLLRALHGDQRLQRGRASAAKRQRALSGAARLGHLHQARFEDAARALDDADRQLQRQKSADHTAAVQLMGEIRRSLMTHRSAAQARSLAEQIDFADNAEPYRTVVVPVATDLFRMTPDALLPSKIRVERSPGERARASLDGTLQFQDPNASEVLHELGHLTEYASPALYQAAVHWRSARSRAADGNLRVLHLQDLDDSYQPDEVAIEDEFYDPYVGATYERWGQPTTEVFTTGLQHFDRGAHMLDLFARDPEHFLFVVGALAP